MATKKAAEKSTPPKAAEKPATTPVSKMTKTQIVKALAEKLATEPKQVQAFFDALVEMATEQTREAGEFTIPGLGKLVKAERKERVGRNPATGEEMKIAAKSAVKFRIAKAATDAIAPPKA
ncbi:MAG: HU family DNA-binding protein [Janthinobacterium lividum]